MDYYEIIRDIKDNPAFRTLVYPFGNYTFHKCSSEYLKSEYPEKIRAFHNFYDGKRCFIIGNGPSLLPEDLEKIKNEFSFGAFSRITSGIPTWCPSSETIALLGRKDSSPLLSGFEPLFPLFCFFRCSYV